MPSNREEAVGGYIRSRLRELDATRARGWQLEFSRVAGFVPSVVAQVKRGLGVGAKTGPGFAKALGFKSYDDLRSAAYRWWEAEGRAPRTATSETAQVAVEAVLALGEGTRAQLEAIVDAYAHPRFTARSRAWWIQTLLNELLLDADADHEARLQGHVSRARQKASKGTEPAALKRSSPPTHR